MDIHQMEYILMIAEENNITRAAERLFISQSALNQQLLKIERELGCQLFYRSRTNWRLTPAGEAYVEGVRRIREIKTDTYQKISDLSHTTETDLRIGLTPGRGIRMFTNIYPHFLRKHGRTHLMPIEMAVRRQQAAMTRGELDLGLVTVNESQKTEHSYITLKQEEMIVAVPSILPAAQEASASTSAPFPQVPFDIQFTGPSPDKASLTESAREVTARLASLPVLDLYALREEPFAMMYKTSTNRELQEEVFKREGFEPHVLLETSSSSSILMLVESAMCCAVLPSYYVDFSLDNVSYFRLHGAPFWELCIMHRKNAYLSEAMRDYIELARTFHLTHPTIMGTRYL